MNTGQLLWILSILAICSVTESRRTKATPEPKTTPQPDKSCNQAVCSLDDVECVTKGSNEAYKKIIKDPLCIEKIVGPSKNGSASYTLIKIEIQGFKSCLITELAPNATCKTFQCTKCCSKLVVNYIYQVCEPSGEVVNKTYTVTANDVVAQSVGDFGIYIGKDNLPHFSIKFVSAVIEIKGNFEIESTTTIQNPNNSVTPLTTSQEADIKNACITIVSLAVKTIIEGVNDYCGKNSISVILPKE